jgi:phosphoserine phosphatase RsbU/P
MSEIPGSANSATSGQGSAANVSAIPFFEQEQSFALLVDVSRELTSILDRQELLQGIADRVKKIVDYHLISVMLWNESSGQLECACAKHYGEAITMRLAVPLYRGVTGHAAGYRCTLRVDDVCLDQRNIEFPHSNNVRSEMVIPLLLQEQLIGVLDLESTTLQRMPSDLDTAREVQCQLLPQGNRPVPGLDIACGYVPARELAGDFYDFLPYGSGRLGIALGDVSGKGSAAALRGSLAVGILREYTQDHRCWPEEMLAVLNTWLNAAHLAPKFVALLFAVYEANLRHLIIAKAGEPRPIPVRKKEIREIEINGTPLGMFPDILYENVTLALQPEDIVVFVSDGILESMNAQDEAFGFDRLAELLRNVSSVSSAENISAAILESTDKFSGRPAEAHDDRTLIVLRVT